MLLGPCSVMNGTLRVSPTISWPLYPSHDSKSADLLSPEEFYGQDMAGEMDFLSCLCLAIAHPEMPTVRHFYWGCYFCNSLYRGSSSFCWIILSYCEETGDMQSFSRLPRSLHSIWMFESLWILWLCYCWCLLRHSSNLGYLFPQNYPSCLLH